MRVEGECHCGAITFTADIDPDAVGLCHCRDCQTLSGSAYRANVPAPAKSFVMQGRPTIYIKTTADSGARRAHAFCADCGTPIYAAALDDPPSYSLRIGAIKQRAALRPARQIWCSSALPWTMDLTGVEQVAKQP